jgi:hypothetical protein
MRYGKTATRYGKTATRYGKTATRYGKFAYFLQRGTVFSATRYGK